jgi:hypothetical protein
MGIGTLLYYILRIVKPYRWLLVVTLVLTLLGSLLAQVNAIVLDRAVDAINVLDQQPTLMWPSAEYAKTHYPEDVITKLSKKPYGYKIELSNDEDMRFTPQGQFIEKID